MKHLPISHSGISRQGIKMKEKNQGFQKRRDFFKRKFRSSDLFIAGLFMIVLFLFNSSTLLRIIQFLIFWFYAWLSGKRNNTFFTILIMIVIVFFNLLIPYGKVIFEYGIFRITKGSLFSGIHKAVTLEGLIMLSKASIRPDLQLPGFFGFILSESLKTFERIMSRKIKFSWKKIIEEIDSLLLELSAEAETQKEQTEEKSIKLPSRDLNAILLLVLAIFPILTITLISFFS